MRKYQTDHYTFMACPGFKVDGKGKATHCNYATTDMDETYCPKCGSKMVKEY